MRWLLMVWATPVPKINAAAKLKNAAHRTAARGDRTRVVTTVATELAASWKPLRKSKTSATPITKKTRYSIGGLPVLQQDSTQGTGHILAMLNCVLQHVVQFLLFHHLQRIGRPGEKFRKKCIAVGGRLFLQGVNLIELSGELFQFLVVAELAHNLIERRSYFAEDVGLTSKIGIELSDVVQRKAASDVGDPFDYVVEVGDELHDVFAVERCDEGVVQSSQGRFHHLGRLHLGLLNLIGKTIDRGKAPDQVVH